MKLFRSFTAIGLVFAPCASAITVAEINGNRYFPSFNSAVTNLTGLVTAVNFGVWIRSTEPDDDETTSESIMIIGLSVWDYSPGDLISLDGTVSNSTVGFEINSDTIRFHSPRNVRVISKGNPVKPVLIGGFTTGIIGNKDMRPPTEQYSRLDNGNVLGFPNNLVHVSDVNPRLQPRQYGMDFFQSLLGELVTITNVTALGRRAKDNSFTGPHIWVYGNWTVTGRNSRGGLTVTDGDANPETIILFDPNDFTKNPNNTKLGDSLTDVTGVIDWIFGHYYLRPVTAPRIKSSRAPALPPPFGANSSGRCDALSVANYNLDYFVPEDSRIPLIVNHIATYLRNPSVIFIQGVEDDSGPANDGTVSANLTLSNLTQALKERTGIPYDFVNIDPVNNADDVLQGTNIRSAYLFNPREVRLHEPNPGNTTDLEAVLPGPSLRFNPGRIHLPLVFKNSPKPLVAQWETIDGQANFFTVNVHWQSYWTERYTLEGNWRPPVDRNVEEHIIQANVTGSLIAQILAQDENAAIIAAGEFREFAFVQGLERFVQISGLQDLDVLAGIPELERYTSTWEPACGSQAQLDHMYVSPSIAKRVGKGDFEHVHVNTWASEENVASFQDPTVARLNVCKR
ncbi:MAG: hypothetical protein L6R40_007243 [Gallowayella cf. fulva]|nr:MAG: hypothetical protein L6R40_007243 [Xanthomendoza cf. fulva]